MTWGAMLFNRKLFFLFGSILISVIILATLWEFGLEKSLYDVLSINHDEETPQEKWEYVFTSASFAGIALIWPFLNLHKTATQRDRLSQSEERYSLAAIGSNSAIWDWNIIDNKVFMSYQAKQILGKVDAGSEMMADYWLQFIHLEDLENYKNCMVSYFRGESDFFRCEYRAKNSNGEYCWLSDRALASRDKNGRAYRVTGTLTDITDQKQKDETEQRLLAAFDSLSETVTIYDAEDRLLFANKKFWGINRPVANDIKIGARYEDFLRLALEKKLFPEAVGREDEWLKKRLADHLNPTGAVEVKRQDGVTLLIHDQALPDGGIATIASDISQIKRVDAALRASEKKLATILEIAPEAVIVIGNDHNIQHFNQGAERMFGYTADEMIGQPLDQLLLPYVRKNHPKHIEAFAKASEDHLLMDRRSDVSALRKDGSVFPASASLSKFEVNGEKIFVAMLHDMTKRKKAEVEVKASKEQAEIANRAKSEFLANMSHELRTPLNAILGFSDMLANETFGKLGDAKNAEAVSAIHTSGSHLMQIIGDILDISKIEAGEATVEDAVNDISESVSSCMTMVRARAEKAGVRLLTDIPEDLPALRSDKRYLKQILINLLSNAVKFTPAGGQITTAARLDDAGGVEITITDTGLGIAPGDISKIMQPFGQVAERQNHSHEGTGLGLPICKSLMELHNGSLSIESEVDAGTTVTVSFPPERTVTP